MKGREELNECGPGYRGSFRHLPQQYLHWLAAPKGPEEGQPRR